MRSHLVFMAGVLALAQALLLTACGKSAPTESAEALAENPERLKELQAECRVDRARVGEAQCMAVADAMRKRFMRPTPSPHGKDPVQPRSAP
ncbi:MULTISPECIES: EexN family lipoprotein [Diaphorobacter]|uniref:EexN family lipoprotein n=1 Tax=Diaphorobacter TaxID=238749 RepID=UPI001E554CA6|nr:MULTISPECIES: EexN family lipoprotein [Diaphorobacter]